MKTHSNVFSSATHFAAVPANSTGQPKLRVLQVINGEYYAGAERVQDLLAGHVSEFGCESSFCCVKPDQFPVKRHYKDAALMTTQMMHPWSRRAVGEIADYVEANNIDVLHSHTPRSSWAAIRAASMTGRPVVHTMHDVFLSFPCNVARKSVNQYTIAQLRKVDWVTTVSDASFQLSEKLGIGQQRSKILNGVPRARKGYRPSAPSGTWNLGMVGLIRPCKGIEVLTRAIARLREDGVNATATIVGTFFTPDYEREVMSLVESLNVTDHMNFVGFSSDVPRHLEQFDLFVMPSVGPEGLPMVLLEAMAHGLPTIGSNVAGVGDVVQPYVEGLLFPVGDHVGLANAVQEFVDGTADWNAMSKASIDRHDREFSASRMARDFTRVYQQVVAARR